MRSRREEVYREKRRGLRTEPCSSPTIRSHEEKGALTTETNIWGGLRTLRSTEVLEAK